MCYIFFFKQKTAYEMRISDWSSDVCSSDLYNCLAHDDRLAGGRALLKGALHGGHEMARIGINLPGARARSGLRHDEIIRHPGEADRPAPAFLPDPELARGRSEERRVGKKSVSTCRSRW